MTGFAEFLKENCNIKVSDGQMFEPGFYNPVSEPPWKQWSGPQAIDASEIETAESSLGCTFPDGYRVFMKTLGPGSWADALFAAPSELYAFDEDVGEMCGFIPLAFNVNGCGDHIAIDPKRPGEVYFCCHDPFGYAVAASSFEDFIRDIARFKIEHKKTADFYDRLSPFHEVELSPPEKPARPWWQFWK